MPHPPLYFNVAFFPRTECIAPSYLFDWLTDSLPPTHYPPLYSAGSNDSTIRLWSTLRLADKHRIEHLHTLSGHTGAVLCIDLSAQYHVLLSGSADCTAALWDVRAGKVHLHHIYLSTGV
jgi:WD40 repeat protein